MAEYYPLLAKAVGSLPNSSPETRRVVYERARKALIGQLRTLHPPIPDEDIEHESVELDRAIERLESELAIAVPIAATSAEPALPVPVEPRKPTSAPAGLGTSGSLGPPPRKPQMPLRTKEQVAKPALEKPSVDKPLPANPSSDTPLAPVPTGSASDVMIPVAPVDAEAPVMPVVASEVLPEPPPPGDSRRPRAVSGADGKPRLEAQRPIAPQPATATRSRRGLWPLFAGVGLIVLLVAGVAWKLRDRPEAIVAAKPMPKAQDNGKIAERVGDKPASPSDQDKAEAPPSAPVQQAAPAEQTTSAEPATPPPANPDLPIAHRAALLIEAPDEPGKVKTILGTVVWKLDNVSAGPSDAVGVAVQAEIDLPDDKTKVVVTFEKNTDSSLPASHTIKIHFVVQPGSATGDVKQISVPQMRREDSPSGDALAGVTVPVVQNTFLVGLSPGNAETANLELLKQLQWIDIPMLLTSGKIAKLTFEKSDSGQRDLNEAIAAWQKS